MVTISNSWTQLSVPGNDGLLISSRGSTQVEIGVTSTNSAPQSGHVFDGSFVIKRSDVGNGYVWARIPDSSNVSIIELEVSKGGELPQAAIGLSGPVTVSNEVEVKNDTGSPITVVDANLGAKADTAATDDTGAFSLIALFKRLLQKVAGVLTVSAAPRNCLGRQTLSVTTGAVVTLTVPTGAVASVIQADGSAISITIDGTTNPTATIGTRIDDGVLYYVDAPLANVRLIARSATTNVQVDYFDKV